METEQQRCVNGTLDDAGYSSPVPVIGLYVAAATLACFLFIFMDILAGFRKRKRWLPCRLFSLNSVTLTLLSVAAKLPVDLTTVMPTPQDQLSKLTGTTLICISMGFLMPSLGVNRGSESWTNMAALTILVITIIVNICIQLHTGVIVLFRAEHIIIMCTMFLLLLALWCFAYDINTQKKVSLDQSKDFLIKGDGSMLRRIKLCYLYSYESNPQLELCRDTDNVLVGVLCLLSLGVVLQAIFRSLVFKKVTLCDQLSDYQWSIKFIIATQIATVTIGSFGTSFRCLTLASKMSFDSMGMSWASKDVEDVITDNPLLDQRFKDSIITILIYSASLVVLLIGILVALPFQIVAELVTSCCTSCCIKSDDRNGEEINEFKELTDESDTKVDEWTLRKGIKDMKKLIQASKGNSIFQLMSRRHPSHPEPLTQQLKNSTSTTTNQSYEISSLSVVLLVKIADVSLPHDLVGSLTVILDEVFKIVHFVDRKMNSTSYKKIGKARLARAAWKGDDFTGLLSKIPNLEQYGEHSSLSKAIRVIEGLKEALPSDLVWDELGIIVGFITSRTYGSIQELYDFIEQLFVDMLNEFFIQLPNAIYLDIVESRPEDLEDTIRFALKAISQVESLEEIIQWAYPKGTTISCLIRDSNLTTNV